MSSPTTSRPCPFCNCVDARGAVAHTIMAALALDDLDRAIEAGLLARDPCGSCSDACASVFVAARDARLRALAARDRYRARQARLQRRADERAAPRTPAAAAIASQPGPALPSAAAAALERAKARAAERRKP